MTQETLRYAIGVDFGGTSVKLALVDSSGRPRAAQRFVTAEAASQPAWLAAVNGAIDQLCRTAGVARTALAGVGIGVPGFVDFGRGFIHDLTNVPGWTAAPLRESAQAAFRLPVLVDNDVNVMALGECRFGAGRQYRHAVFVTLGTGVGGGLLLDGRLYRGAYSMAGEIGHLSIDLHGVRSPQGVGGLEQYVGNRRLAARAVEALRAGRASQIATLVGGRLDEVTPEIIDRAAAAGDALALELFDFMADCLAAAFASTAYLIQPQAFIVGGGVAQSGERLFGPLRRHLTERLSPHFAQRLEVVPAALGNEAGVIGGAALMFGDQA